MKNLLLIAVLCLSVQIHAQTPFSIEPNTEALYHFDEGSGTTLFDVTGNGHNGTLNGATWTTGMFGGGLNFDGNDYVNLGTSLNFSSTNFTIEIWVNVGDTTDERLDIMSGLDPGLAGGWMMSYRNFMFQNYVSSTNGSGTGLAQGGGAIQGQWHYIAMTYDGNDTGQELKTYVDGLLVAAGSTGYPDALPLSLKLGAGGNLAAYKYFNGQLDELRFSNEAKSSCEIFSYFNNSSPPVASFTSSSSAVCEGSNITLTNTGTGSTVEWFDNGVSIGTNNVEIYSMMGIGTHNINMVVSDGVCIDSSQITVTVNPLPTVTASGTATICDGQSTSLTAGGASTYSWDNSAGTGSPVSVSPSTTTTYTVTGTDANTCTNTAQVTVTVNPLPTVTASGTATICDGQSTSLTAGGASTYSWDNSAGTGSPVSVSPSTTTTYTVTGTDANTCTNTAQVTVTVNPLPDVTVSQSGIVLTAQNVNAGITYQWVDCNNSFQALSSETNQDFTASINGSYAVVINENSCADTSSCYNVTSVGIIENNFGNQLIVYPNPTNGDFSVDLGENHQTVQITITDLVGKIIQSYTYNDSQLLKFKIEEPAGVYFLMIESGEKQSVIRIIKE